MNSSARPDTHRSMRNVTALGAIFSLIASILVFVSFTPATAATNIDLIVHVPAAASESNTVTVTPSGGTAVTSPYKYDDDYGAFAIVTVPSAQTNLTITATGFPNGGSFTRTGAEIWLDSSGEAFKSRFLAQDCSLDVTYIAESNADAINADLMWNEDGGADSGTITIGSISGTRSTFTYDGDCDANPFHSPQKFLEPKKLHLM